MVNLDKVKKRVLEVEVRDEVWKFQAVITGAVIVKTFTLKPSVLVGLIKEAVKKAILEVTNNTNFPFF